jgi:hypothetical protein
MFDKIKRVLLGGADQEKENQELLDAMSKEELITIVNKQKEEAKQKEEELMKYKLALLQKRKEREENKQSIDKYTEINIDKWMDVFRAEDSKHQNPEVIEYDEDISTFDLIKGNKNKNYKFRPYQKKFIEDWSIATNELVILYYGVGSGKTLIAINCAEQFINLNPDSYIYMLMPASLVINTIMKMYDVGLDPRRKNKDGQYVYKFISYQQLMLSKVDIKPNSLLIIDEAHNLRNFGTKEIKEKESARKWKPTGNYSLLGNKVADLLLKNQNTFLRTIMMTGTLFCNSPDDIEALIGIGYKKAPLVNLNRDDLLQIHNDSKQFDRYYGGLISFFRLKDNDPDFPRKKYHFIPIEAEMSMQNSIKDPYYQEGRNSGMKEKSEWIINFLSHKSRTYQKTLIYAEFMDKAIQVLMKELVKRGFLAVVISGNESAMEKQAGINFYNTDRVKILVFSKAIKEGISFKETNNFIFMQPYWNYAISEQIIARAVRLDSHKQKQRSLVDIYCLVGVNGGDIEVYDDDELKKIQGGGQNLGKIDNIEIINCPDDLVDKQKEYAKIYTEKLKEIEEFKLKGKEDIRAKTIKEWIKQAEDIMNNNIKTLRYKRYKEVRLVKERSKTTGNVISQYFDAYDKIDFRQSSFSRDTYIWDMMFNKQENINVFEDKLLQPHLAFENYLTNENNEFIQEYNLELEKKAHAGNPLSRKQEIELKRQMYKKFYDKKIAETNKEIQRFATDTNFKVNKNPDLQQLAQQQYNDTDVYNKIKGLFDKKASLTEILNSFNIDKQQITNFQANFTSGDNIKTIIDMSKIKDDKRDKIMVLEPTSGIGGVITYLLKECNNKDNFMIDSNEYHNVFYNFQKVLYKGIDNIFVYNTDFMTYQSRYEYDYILGNPPFNLRLQQKRIKPARTIKIRNEDREIIREEKVGEMVSYVDINLFDVDFVAQAYNLLKNPTAAGQKDGGILTMIISDRYTRDTRQKSFIAFREFIKKSSASDPSSVNIVNTGEFDYQKGSEEGTKEMTTKYPMVCIYLRKLYNINMNLSKKDIDEEEGAEKKDEEKTAEQLALEELKGVKMPSDKKKKKEAIKIEIDEDLKKELDQLILPTSRKRRKSLGIKFNLDEDLEKEYKAAIKKPRLSKKLLQALADILYPPEKHPIEMFDPTTLEKVVIKDDKDIRDMIARMKKEMEKHPIEMFDPTTLEKVVIKDDKDIRDMIAKMKKEMEKHPIEIFDPTTLEKLNIKDDKDIRDMIAKTKEEMKQMKQEAPKQTPVIIDEPINKLNLDSFKMVNRFRDAIQMYYANKGQRLTNLDKSNFEKLKQIVIKRNIDINDLAKFYIRELERQIERLTPKDKDAYQSEAGKNALRKHKIELARFKEEMKMAKKGGAKKEDMAPSKHPIEIFDPTTLKKFDITDDKHIRDMIARMKEEMADLKNPVEPKTVAQEKKEDKITADQINDKFKFIDDLINKGKESPTPSYEGWFSLSFIMTIILGEKYNMKCPLITIRASKDDQLNLNPYIPGNTRYLGSTEIYAYRIRDCIKKGEKVLVQALSMPGHANMLIVKVDTREILRFEPGGETGFTKKDEAYVNKYIEEITKKVNNLLKLKKTPFKYIRTDQTCPRLGKEFKKGFQHLDLLYKNNEAMEGGGYCQLWSFFFADCILKNPDMDFRDVYKNALDVLNNKPERARMLIRGYYHEINEKMTEYAITLSQYIKNIPKIDRAYDVAITDFIPNILILDYIRKKSDALDDQPDTFEGTGKGFIMPDSIYKGEGKEFIMPESIYKRGDGTRSPYYYKTQGKGVIDTVKAFFTGRNDYPPNIRKFIEQNKDLTITKMRVGRRPIKSFITTVGNAITLGALKETMKKHSYDDLLHLWLEFTMSNGNAHIVEKDEVVKIGPVDNREGEKTDFMDVPIKNTVNVYDFFYKPLKGVGKNLIEYSAHKYNCQNFVMNLLKYSNNLTPELNKFIMQDVEKMLADPKFSLHKTFIKFLTDAAAKVDVLKQGAGKNKMQGKGIMDWLKKHKNKLVGTLGTIAGLAGVYGIKALHHQHLINKAEKEANEMMDNYINRRQPKKERRNDEPDTI